jgi:hypothetical protein
MKARTALASLSALISAASGVRGQSALPADLQATIVARVLAYDRGLKARAGSSVGVVVVFKVGSGPSTQAQAEIVTAFGALRATIQGLPLTVSAHPFKDAATLGAAATRDGIDVLYVTPGLDNELPAIRQLCAQHRLVGVSSVRAFVEQGLAVGVVSKGDRPGILVNKAIADSVGMDLDPKLLQLSEVLR